MPTSRFEHLDGLRGLAATIVLVSHGLFALDFALYTGRAEDGHGGWDAWLSGAPFLIPLAGHFAVCIFFALSGFVLAHAFSRTSLAAAALATKRYIRLALPVLAVCLLSYLLLAAGLMRNHEAATITHSSWLDIQMRQSPSLLDAVREGAFGAFFVELRSETSYDSNLWTMPVEMAGSLALIALFGVLRTVLSDDRLVARWAGRILLLIAIAGFTSYLGLIAAGGALYLYRERFRLEGFAPPAMRRLIVVLVLVLALFLGTIPFSAAPWPIVRPFVPFAPIPEFLRWPFASISLWHSFAAVIMLAIVEATPLLRQVLATRALRWLGAISFPLYLVQIPLLMWVECGVLARASEAGWTFGAASVVALAAFLAVSFLVAYALTILVERPALWLSAAAASAIDRAIRATMGRADGGTLKRRTAADVAQGRSMRWHSSPLRGDGERA